VLSGESDIVCLFEQGDGCTYARIMSWNKFHLDRLDERYGIREEMMCYDGHLETLIVVIEPKPSR
jgi:hypothetical protein